MTKTIDVLSSLDLLERQCLHPSLPRLLQAEMHRVPKLRNKVACVGSWGLLRYVYASIMILNVDTDAANIHVLGHLSTGYVETRNVGLSHHSLYCAATRFFAPKAAVTPDATTMSTQPPGTTNTETIDPWSLPPKQATSAWPLGDALSMHVYLTTSPRPDLANLKEGGLPHFVWDGLTYGDYKDTRSVEYNVDFPEVCHLVC